jgi:AcrR family transcriptional regulator
MVILAAKPAPSPSEAPPQIPARQTEILAGVRQAFIEKGFDGASMQDLARAAGMSVGNFYRYFPSKAAIIRAMVLVDAQEIRADFDLILAAPRPMEALRASMRSRIFGPDCAVDSALWSEIEAAARRTPEVAEAHRLIGVEVQSRLIAVFAAETGLPLPEAQSRFATHAAFLLTLFKAAACADARFGIDTTPLRAMIAETIETKLAEISATRSDPPLG